MIISGCTELKFRQYHSSFMVIFHIAVHEQAGPTLRVEALRLAPDDFIYSGLFSGIKRAYNNIIGLGIWWDQ